MNIPADILQQATEALSVARTRPDVLREICRMTKESGVGDSIRQFAGDLVNGRPQGDADISNDPRKLTPGLHALRAAIPGGSAVGIPLAGRANFGKAFGNLDPENQKLRHLMYRDMGVNEGLTSLMAGGSMSAQHPLISVLLNALGGHSGASRFNKDLAHEMGDKARSDYDSRPGGALHNMYDGAVGKLNEFRKNHNL